MWRCQWSGQRIPITILTGQPVITWTSSPNQTNTPCLVRRKNKETLYCKCSEESPPNRVIARRLSVRPLLNVHEEINTITRFRCLYTNKNKITTLHTWSVCTSQARTFTACIQCLFRVDTQSSQINANDTRWKIGFAFYLNTPHYLIVQLNCSSPLWPQQQMLIKNYIYSYFKWVHCKYVKAALSVQIKASYSPYYIFLALSLWIFLL